LEGRWEGVEGRQDRARHGVEMGMGGGELRGSGRVSAAADEHAFVACSVCARAPSLHVLHLARTRASMSWPACLGPGAAMLMSSRVPRPWAPDWQAAMSRAREDAVSALCACVQVWVHACSVCVAHPGPGHRGARCPQRPRPPAVGGWGLAWPRPVGEGGQDDGLGGVGQAGGRGWGGQDVCVELEIGVFFLPSIHGTLPTSLLWQTTHPPVAHPPVLLLPQCAHTCALLQTTRLAMPVQPSWPRRCRAPPSHPYTWAVCDLSPSPPTMACMPLPLMPGQHIRDAGAGGGWAQGRQGCPLVLLWHCGECPLALRGSCLGGGERSGGKRWRRLGGWL
jgi:hypothetical protein